MDAERKLPDHTYLQEVLTWLTDYATCPNCGEEELTVSLRRHPRRWAQSWSVSSEPSDTAERPEVPPWVSIPGSEFGDVKSAACKSCEHVVGHEWRSGKAPALPGWAVSMDTYYGLEDRPSEVGEPPADVLHKLRVEPEQRDLFVRSAAKFRTTVVPYLKLRRVLKCLRRSSSSTQVLINCALAYHVLGEDGRAMAALQEALDADPTHTQALVPLAITQNNWGMTLTAALLLSDAVEEGNRSREAILLGMVLNAAACMPLEARRLCLLLTQPGRSK